MKHRKQLLPLGVVSLTILLIVLLGNSLRAGASVAPFTRYQQTYSVTLMSDLATIRGAQPGYIASCSENGKAYVAQPAAAYAVSSPRVIGGADGIVWVDFLTIASPVTSGFIGSITWGQIVPSSIPTTVAGHSIVDAVTTARRITGTAPITVNGAASATLANDITLGLNYGTTASSVSLGGTNSPGISPSAARADHIHAAPPVGTTAGTLAAGNDSRFTDDRVADRLRTATTVVSIGTAAAPSANQVMTALSTTSGSWKLIGNPSIEPNAAIALSKLATCGTYELITGGTSNSCSAMTDFIHGNRGGGLLHAAVSSAGAGFAPTAPASGSALLTSNNGTAWWASQIGSPYIVANGTANRALTTTDGTNASWTQITNAMLAGSIDWSTKLTGYPTITATAPLRIDSGASATLSTSRTLSITPASGSSAGSMSAQHYTRLDGIPDATTAQQGLVLTPSGTTANVYTLASPSSLGLLAGSGTPGRLTRFTGVGVSLADSALFQSATGIGLGTTSPLGLLDVATGGVGLTVTGYNLAGLSLTPWVGTARLVLGWNRTDGGGEQDFIANRGGGSTGGFAFYDLAGSGVLTQSMRLTAAGNLSIPGQITIGGGSPGAGKMLQSSDTSGAATWSSDLSGITGITFGSTVANPTITQAPTTVAPTALRIEAQSTTTGYWGTGNVGNVIINVGHNNANTQGKIRFGFSSADGHGDGAYGIIDQLGTTFSTRVTTPVLDVSGTEIRGPASYAIDAREWTEWAQVDTTAGGTVTFNFGFAYALDNILPSSSQFHVEAEIMAAGAISRTFQYTGTWTKSAGGVLYNTEYNSFGNGGGLGVGGATAGNNAMTIIVGCPSGAIRWTAKITTTRVPLP